MNKRFLLLIALLLTVNIITQAQPWLNSIDRSNDKQDLTLKEHKQAFDAYWTRHNVKNGYYYENGVKKKAYGWKQFMRWYYNMQYQVDAKTGAFPRKTAQQVYEEFKRTHPSLRSNENPAAWTSLGPNSSDGGYDGIGRINCVAFHPTDNNTYWVGAPAGGLWVTRDNGATWTCLTDQNQVLGVSDIIIPSDYVTSQTIYIGTGDRDGWDNRGVGVLKSTDDGATWHTTGLTFNLNSANRINRLLLDPNSDQIIIAATEDGVYKTTNGGANWNKLSDNVFIDMEYKPGDFSTIYGSTEYGGISVSTNGGNSWRSIFSRGSRIELAVSPANPSLVAAVVANSEYGLYGVYKSTDSGNSFTQVLNGTTKNLLGWDDSGNNEGGQGWYDLAIAVSPIDANIIFVGGVNTWQSTDGGTNWNISSHWAGSPQTVHADKHTLKYRANGDLFEGNDGGIYISTNNGGNWIDKSNGLVIGQMYKLGVSAQESTKTITGLQDNGSRLLDNGTWRDVTGGDGMECLIDYTNSNTQYATYANGELYRTNNNWGDYETITPKEGGQTVKGAWVTPYVISPIDHNTLYAGYADVWKTTDKGNTWTRLATTGAYDNITSMAIAPSNSSILYVTDNFGLYKTTNEGNSWSEITPSSLSGNITYITIKSDDPNHLWITTGGYNNQGVYESTDGGTSWTNISNGLPQIPVYTIVQNKQITNEVHLYVGTELGVYLKKGNDNWVEYNEGLPKVKCGELEIYYDNAAPANSRLRLASYGRGLWETPLVLADNIIAITTVPVTSTTTNSAVSGGNIRADGGSAITARGIVWGTATQPTLADNVVTDTGTGTGSFSSNITGLSASTTYYVRAYATNANGTTYGNELTFTTPCEAITTFPYKEGFEGSTFPPQCWASFRGINGLGTTNDWRPDNQAHSGSKAAYTGYESVAGGNAEDWLVTPPLTLPLDSASLSFYQKQSDSQNWGSSYAIKISNESQSNIPSFTNLETYDETTFGTDYTKKEIDLSAYVGQTIYIAFVMTNNNGDSWFIDDVKIDGTNDTTAPPVANFSASTTEVCAGSAVNFTDASTSIPTSWSWDFGDGTPTVTEQDPSHTYTTTGTYTVSLTATNKNGSNTKTIDNYITVKVAPNAGTNGTLTVCTGTNPSETDLFNALGGNPDEGGSWTNNGLIYTYTVNPTAPCTDVATATVTVTEKPLPEANFTIDISGSPTIIFTNTSINANSYNWNLGDGTTVNRDDVEHTYTANATYTINLKATNDCGDSNHEKTLTITTVGIKTINEENIKIYPNPTNNHVEIELGENYNQVKSVSIIDNWGKKLSVVEKVEKPVISLSVKDLVKGIYFVNILKNNKKITLKLIVSDK